MLVHCSLFSVNVISHELVPGDWTVVELYVFVLSYILTDEVVVPYLNLEPGMKFDAIVTGVSSSLKVTVQLCSEKLVELAQLLRYLYFIYTCICVFITTE